MRIKLERADKVELLKALQSGYLETDDVPALAQAGLKIEVVTAREEIERLEQLEARLSERGENNS